jgi:hypothetical protein
MCRVGCGSGKSDVRGPSANAQLRCRPKAMVAQIAHSHPSRPARFVDKAEGRFSRASTAFRTPLMLHDALFTPQSITEGRNSCMHDKVARVHGCGDHVL